jgi:hypothetical protein
VAVHSVAFVRRRNFRQTVRRLETECLCYFHGISDQLVLLVGRGATDLKLV